MNRALLRKKILVTGATGFLGSRLVEYLANYNNQYDILATGRKFSFANKCEHKNVIYSLGDLADVSFVKSLFDKQIDVVINCASLAAPWGSREKFEISNLDTQNNLIQACVESAVERFIYISTPSIYFNYKDSYNISEKSPIPSKHFSQYARTKYEAEKLLKESSLRYIILRPRALVGRGDTVLIPRIIRASKGGRLRILGAGKNLVNITSVSNMVEAIRLAIHSSYLDEDYNISNGEAEPLWDIINKILVKIGREEIKKKIPYWIAMQIAVFMELKAKITNSRQEPRLTKFGVKILTKSSTFDISKAKEKLGYKVKQSNNEAIEEFVKWYKETNWF